MGQLDGVVRKINALTGRTARQNRKLQVISEWLETVTRFMEAYSLLGQEPLGTLLLKTGNAKFDLVGIIHNGRPVVNESKTLKESQFYDLIVAIVEGAESTRRYLIKPELQQEHLIRTIMELRDNHDKLQASIDGFDAG